MKQVIFALALLALLGSGQASAAVSTCDGFVDVSGGSSFCPNVEYLVNRSITVGCTDSTHFCPTDYVTRLSMAAFLNRLGSAVTPVFEHATQVQGLSADTSAVVCQTSAYAVTGYQRTAIADASYFINASTSGTAQGRLVYSLDGGSTWKDMASYYMQSTLASGSYTQGTSTSTFITVSPGASIVFGLDVSLLFGGAGEVDCELRARLDNAADAPVAPN